VRPTPFVVSEMAFVLTTNKLFCVILIVRRTLFSGRMGSTAPFLVTWHDGDGGLKHADTRRFDFSP
jgi:hypothetical protein